jgi:hypothetical protein
MDLKCTVVSVWGKTLNVNGTDYTCSKEGEIRGVKDADAKKLLGFPGGQYKELGASAPTSSAPAAAAPKTEEPKSSEATTEEKPAKRGRRGFGRSSEK